MAIVRYDPFRNVFSMPRWLDELENEYPTGAQRGLKVHETEKEIVLEAVVAGIPSDQVEVNIEDGVVTIKAESKNEESKKGEYKSSFYQYYYTTVLSGGDWTKAEAEVEHGVVTVTIPKAEAAKPRKITVKAKKK